MTLRKMLVGWASGTLLLLCPQEASAATHIVNANGQLTGATGVLVGGTAYDVEFVDGTCSAIFTGCDSPSDFILTGPQALAAANALLEQVFTNSAAGSFDTIPSLTLGCESDFLCRTLIPSQQAFNSSSTSILASYNGSQDIDGVGFAILGGGFDSTLTEGFNFARFKVSAVPEPATWLMMLIGFAAIGIGQRGRLHKRSLLQQA